MEISKVFGQYIRSAFWGNKKPPAVAEGCGCILTQANICSETCLDVRHIVFNVGNAF